MPKKEVALTKRQMDVLKLLVNGYDNGEVAERLNIKYITVQAHRSTIMVKLGLHDLAALVKYALRNNLTTLD